MGIQVCRLPALLQPTGTPGPHLNGFYGRPSLPFGALKALKPSKPSKRLKRSKRQTSKPIRTRKTCGPRVLRLAANSHPAPHINGLIMAILAANRSTPGPHIKWLLMGIYVCRLPALLQPTGTPGPHLNGFLWGFQVCRLPALKPLKPWQTAPERLKRSKPFKTVLTRLDVGFACFVLQPTATPRHTSMASYGHSCSQQAPQGHTSMASYGHLSLPFASSFAANRHLRATHPSKPSKPSKRLKRSKPLKTVKRWLRVLRLQPTVTPRHTSMASYGHSCSQQAPQGHTSMASYGHPSLPFASSLAANRHPRATPQWLLMGVQVCRLPALKPLKPSKPSKRLKRLKPSKPLKTVKPVKIPKTLLINRFFLAFHGYTEWLHTMQPTLPPPSMSHSFLCQNRTKKECMPQIVFSGQKLTVHAPPNPRPILRPIDFPN